MEEDILKSQEVIEGAKEIADHYGIKHQAYQAIQEMAELIKELTDNINDGEKNIEEIEKETADVLVMIIQLIYLYGMDNTLDIMLKKINRQKKRMKKEKNIKKSVDNIYCL